MKSTKIKTKTEKGITLIALIITIVVLLILAAVAINSITNEGILSQAGSTANKYNQAVKNEESYLQDYEDILTAANGGYETYGVGEEVTIGTESFYVIEDKTAQGKVVLLAKQNIIADKTDSNYLTQSASAGAVAFSTESYWGEMITDIVEPATIPESHIAARAAYDYGVKIGGKGRLMTYKEADDLSKTTFSTKLYETNFWLGYTNGGKMVYVVYSFEGGGVTYDEFDFVDYGVRPVIEISKSKLS